MSNTEELIQQAIHTLTDAIIKTKKTIERLQYECPMNVDRHDDDLSFQQKRRDILLSVRTELEESL